MDTRSLRKERTHPGTSAPLRARGAGCPAAAGMLMIPARFPLSRQVPACP